ncbi:uncharacterized protein [Rutidosis leptorrhynchoides]|uniref:uncharacterized protein n=1 Tax=Rutidosis leptorrhynchoides TaxID=125765 RepID=UPI003A99A9C4
MAWTKWDSILAPHDVGGLNVSSLKAFNLALIHKWKWWYLTQIGDFWVSIIKAIHGNVFECTTSHSSSPWIAIVSCCSKTIVDSILLGNAIRMEVGNGIKVTFWHDLWCGNSCLSSGFNRLFHLDINKNDVIAIKRRNEE